MRGHAQVIAKNTFFLYIRTIIIILIAIYTSRVLLYKLGIENFGLYNLVGGVIGLFGSLKGVFAQSVQRFLNYEKGCGNKEKVNAVFNISLVIHLCLGIIFSLLVLCFGIYYIPRFVVLPDEMLQTAMFVFYCSIATAFISILTIPYDSVVIANERFDFYAIISIVDVLARLSIIFLIPFFEYNSLCTYAILIVIVTFIIRLIYIIYSLSFEECKIKKIWDNDIFKELSVFSGWNFLGNTAYSLTNEGINFVINSFGGVTANAARGLAYQIKNAVLQLSGNIVISSRPYVSEAVANHDVDTIFGYIIKVSRITFLLVALTALPIIVYSEQILNVWLIEVPENAVVFVQLVMIHLVIRTPQSAIDLLFSSYAKMKWYQIVQSISLFLSLPLSYIFLKIGLPLYWAFISMCIIEFITLIAIIICARKVFGFSIKNYFTSFGGMALCSSILFLFLGFLFFKMLMPSSLLSLIVDVALLVSISVFLSYVFLLNREERHLVKSLINHNHK